MIDGARRRVESDLAFFRQRNLQARVSEELVLVGGAIHNPAQARMHERDVQLLEVVLDVERPVRVDHVISGRGLVEPETIDRKPAET